MRINLILTYFSITKFLTKILFDFLNRLKITFLTMTNQLGAGLEVPFAQSIVTILSSSTPFNSILAALMSFTTSSTNYLITTLEKLISTSKKFLDLLITQIKNPSPRLSSKLENLRASQKKKKVSTIGCDIFMKTILSLFLKYHSYKCYCLHVLYIQIYCLKRKI